MVVAARKIGAFHRDVLRGWLKRGELPQDIFVKVVNLLNVSTKELNDAGIRQAKWSTKESPVRRNLLPLLKKTVESGEEFLSYEELDYLIKYQGKLSVLMSSAQIQVLLRRRREG